MALTNDLKQSILLAAISGRLTEQLKTDTPVDTYLADLEYEKEQYGGKRKARRGVNLSDISEDEIPCEIPQTWRYVRLIDIVKSISAGGDKPKNFSKEKTEKNTIEVISNGETNKGIFGYTDKPVITETSLTISGRGTIGYSVIRTEPYVPIVRLLVVLPLSGTNLEYIKVVLTALIEFGSGTAVKQLTVPMISPKVIPLPPMEEQQRIVECVNMLMGKLDEFSVIEQQLITLKENFPADMRGALLQAAMQGKLTEQLKSDGSVDDLIKIIMQEKQALIDAHKIKQEKPLPSIADDEIPFEIPNSWAWVRWGNLSNSIQYGYNAPAQPNGRIRMVRISDIQNNEVNWSTVPFCEISESEIETYRLNENDILFARTGGTLGKSYIVTNMTEEAIYAGYLIRSNYSKRLCPQFLKYFMESPLYWLQLQNGTTKTAQPNCNGKTLSKMLIPLPPVEEQQRIVERLDTLLPLCDTLME